MAKYRKRLSQSERSKDTILIQGENGAILIDDRSLK